MTARRLPILAMLALLPLSHVWAAQSSQRFKCDVLVSDKPAQTTYVTVHAVDLGEYWSWKADGDCASFLLDSDKSTTQAPTMFPKVLANRPDWKSELLVTLTGKNGYPAGSAQMRFHAMPADLLGTGQNMRFDVKVRQDMASKQATQLYVEQSTVFYKPATGELQRLSGRVKDSDRKWNSFTLVNCNQPGVTCPADPAATANAAPADVKVTPMQ